MSLPLLFSSLPAGVTQQGARLASAQTSTFTAAAPLSAHSAFSVHFHTKEPRTAIGIAASPPPLASYLTPDRAASPDYVSFGGAGFIYPFRRSATRGYTVGDTVTVSLRDATVTFAVNGTVVGSAPWAAAAAFACLSCEGGRLDVTVTQHSC